MTNEQILKKAIEKAVENGFAFNINSPTIKPYLNSEIVQRGIIFDHDFAKAFWGERKEGKKIEGASHQVIHNLGWEYFLQQIVLEEEPLKYLEKFL